MRRVLLLAAVLAQLGCRPARPDGIDMEFLLAAGDSTYWVRLSSEGVRMRRSPIHLSRVNDRFMELYVADDDRSHPDAIVLGQRLFRRDLITGDSLLVLDDSVIADFSRWYGRGRRSSPLEPGQQPQEDAHLAAVSELTILDQHGRWLSYEYAASVDVPGAESWETVTRGVADLVAGGNVPVRSIFGAVEAARISAVAETLFAQTLDSLLASRDARAHAALGVIGDFRLDTSAFSLTLVGDRPAVEFVLAGRGPLTGGMLLTLEPIAGAAPPEWEEIRTTLPAVDVAGVHRWTEGARSVSAHPAQGRYQLRARSANGRVLNVGRVPGPLWRIFWLHHDSIDNTTRRALERAFDEAAFYDEDVRTAMTQPNPDRKSGDRQSRPVSYSLHETSEIMMPQHANNLGHVFGGVILSMMDRTAAVSAIRHARGTCVTVSVDRVDFRQPIHLGELVIMQSSVNFAGRSSVEVGVRVEAENMLTGVRRHTNSCYLTFVAVDTAGRPMEVPQVQPETPDQHRRYAAAQERRRRRLEERTAEQR